MRGVVAYYVDIVAKIYYAHTEALLLLTTQKRKKHCSTVTELVVV